MFIHNWELIKGTRHYSLGDDPRVFRLKSALNCFFPLFLINLWVNSVIFFNVSVVVEPRGKTRMFRKQKPAPVITQNRMETNGEGLGRES